jgi:hypothetical protein
VCQDRTISVGTDFGIPERGTFWDAGTRLLLPFRFAAACHILRSDNMFGNRTWNGFVTRQASRPFWRPRP